jgi:hypothetical protein
MIIYLVIFILLSVAAIVECIFQDQLRLSQKKTVYIFFVFLLICLAGFRWETGFDFESYYELFYSLKNNSKLTLSVEPGVLFLQTFFSSFAYYILFVAIFSITLKSYFFCKQSPFPFLSLFIYFSTVFLLYEMGQIRQSIAISFVLVSIFYKNIKWKQLIFIFIAIVFHYSAILAILLLFIPNKTFNNTTYILPIVIAFIFTLFMSSIFMYIYKFLPSLAVAKIEYYLLEEEGISGISTKLLTYKLFLCTLLIIYKNKLMLFKLGYYFINIYFLSVVIYVVFKFIPQIAGRGSLYFSIFEIILVPMLFSIVKMKSNRIIISVLLVFLYSYFYFSALITWQDVLIPYKQWLLK